MPTLELGTSQCKHFFARCLLQLYFFACLYKLPHVHIGVVFALVLTVLGSGCALFAWNSGAFCLRSMLHIRNCLDVCRVFRRVFLLTCLSGCVGVEMGGDDVYGLVEKVCSVLICASAQGWR